MKAVIILLSNSFSILCEESVAVVEIIDVLRTTNVKKITVIDYHRVSVEGGDLYDALHTLLMSGNLCVTIK